MYGNSGAIATPGRAANQRTHSHIITHCSKLHSQLKQPALLSCDALNLRFFAAFYESESIIIAHMKHNVGAMFLTSATQ